MRGSRWVVLALSLGLVAAACSSNTTTGTQGGSQQLTPVTFRLDWIVDGSHTCFFDALTKGYFRQQGLDVQILEGAGSGTAATLVANGSNDFGFSDAGVVAKTIDSGAEIKMVAGIYQRTPSIIISLKSSNINGPEDLVGKTVGDSFGAAPLQLLPAYLNANGVDPNQVEVVNITPGAVIPALLNGRIDALLGYSSSDLPVAEAEAPGQLAVQHYADFGVVTLSNGIITSDEMIRNRPEVVRGFVNAVQMGYADCQEDPAAAIGLLVDRFLQTVNKDQATVALREVVGNLHSDRTKDMPVGYMDPQDWADTLKTLEQYGVLTSPQAPETYFTNDFVST
jgi:NitT/TauT family transport system substrate-binding protein